MSRSRSLRYLLEAFSLVAVVAITLTAAAYACDVTNQTVVSETDQECVTILGVDNVIFKQVNWSITFVWPALTAPRVVWGLGTCGYPSLGGTAKCYPSFDTPEVGPCDPSSSNCIRWSQIVQGRSAEDCGFLVVPARTMVTPSSGISNTPAERP